jgi:hypothetical protein
MMAKVRGFRIYTVVQVWRGIAAGAKSFPDLSRAQQYMRRAQGRRNPLEDDVQLFEGTIRLVSPARRPAHRAKGAEET